MRLDEVGGQRPVVEEAGPRAVAALLDDLERDLLAGGDRRRERGRGVGREVVQGGVEAGLPHAPRFAPGTRRSCRRSFRCSDATGTPRPRVALVRPETRVALGRPLRYFLAQPPAPVVPHPDSMIGSRSNPFCVSEYSTRAHLGTGVPLDDAVLLERPQPQRERSRADARASARARRSGCGRRRGRARAAASTCRRRAPRCARPDTCHRTTSHRHFTK